MQQQTTTWSQVLLELDKFLKDEPHADTGVRSAYPAQLRVFAWNWAQRYFAITHTPRQGTEILTIDSDNRSAVLPEDFMAVWRIHEGDREEWMVPMPRPVQGQVFQYDKELAQYWTWGQVLMFTETVTSVTVTLYYWGYWPEVAFTLDEENENIVVYTEEQIVVPPWAMLPLCHLTAATCLAPGALEAARSRQWNITVDSGNPVQNARAVQAKEHLTHYEWLIGRIPPPKWRDSEYA